MRRSNRKQKKRKVDDVDEAAGIATESSGRSGMPTHTVGGAGDPMLRAFMHYPEGAECILDWGVGSYPSPPPLRPFPAAWRHPDVCDSNLTCHLCGAHSKNNKRRTFYVCRSGNCIAATSKGSGARAGLSICDKPVCLARMSRFFQNECPKCSGRCCCVREGDGGRVSVCRAATPACDSQIKPAPLPPHRIFSLPPAGNPLEPQMWR
jgi:hypothetical protein